MTAGSEAGKRSELIVRLPAVLAGFARRLGMARWREEIFAFMHHNAQRPGPYFKIPSGQVMEIGLEFEI